MTQFDLLVRVGLTVVYCTAALGKLLSPQSTRRLIETFELDQRLVPVVSALPLVELSVAGLLLFGSTSREAGAGSCAFLVFVSAFIVRNLQQGRTGNCGCFGRFHSSKTGRRSLLRNAFLILASGLLVLWPTQPGVGLLAHDLAVAFSHIWFDAAASLVALGSAAILLSYRLLRPRSLTTFEKGASRRDSTSPTALQQATGAHLLTGVTTLDDQPATLTDLLASDRRNVLVFVDPDCRSCKSLLPLLHAWWNLITADSLFIVTRGPLSLNRQMLAGFPANRVLLDINDALLNQFGMPGAPSAVLLRASDARVESVLYGPIAIEEFLRRSTHAGLEYGRLWPKPRRRGAAGPLASLALTRREALTAGLSSAFVTVLMPRFAHAGNLLAKLPAAKQTGVSCPSCGPCTICEAPASTASKPGKLNCRPCTQKCSANNLCVNYANKLPAYLSIHSYLLSKGFKQSGGSKAAGLQQSGKLLFIGTFTEFQSTSPSSPKAVLTYTLTNNGGIAAAAIFDSHGHITSVVLTNSAGQVVTLDVPTPPKASTSKAAASVGIQPMSGAGFGQVPSRQLGKNPSEVAVLDAYSCSDVCGVLLGLMIEVLTGLAASEFSPFLLGFGVAVSLASAGTGLAGSGIGFAVVQAAKAATAWNAVLAGYSEAAKEVICETLICEIKLEGCCNYTGKCFDLDAVCEKNCPGGLKHPMAHCDVYMVFSEERKVLISTIGVPLP